MPGSTAAWTDGWGGREPLAVVAARALAPWPLWLLAWNAQDGPHRSAFFLTVSGLVVALMTWRAARGADRSIAPAGVGLCVALAFGASVLFEVSTAAVRDGCTGALSSMLVAWLSGALLYEMGKRCLRTPELEPPLRVGATMDVVAHQIAFAAPLFGLVDVCGQGLPLPVLIGPLVAMRVAGWHDARLPPAGRRSLGTSTVFGLVGAVVLLGAMLQEPTGRGSSAAIAWTVSAAGVSALLAAVVLAARAGAAARSLWGVVYEHRADGIVLDVGGGGGRVHVIPKDPRPGGGMPAADAPITFLDVEPVDTADSPYREGPRMVRARVAWRGTAEELAGTLLSRAWWWLAWAALSFAAAVSL